MIRIELTHGQFYDLYRNNEFVRNFSFDGVDALLDIIEEKQEDNSEIIDWTEVFMNASEYTYEAYISEFSTEEQQEIIEEDYEKFADDVNLQIAMVEEIAADRYHIILDNDHVLFIN